MYLYHHILLTMQIKSVPTRASAQETTMNVLQELYAHIPNSFISHCSTNTLLYSIFIFSSTPLFSSPLSLSWSLHYFHTFSTNLSLSTSNLISQPPPTFRLSVLHLHHARLTFSLCQPEATVYPTL